MQATIGTRMLVLTYFIICFPYTNSSAVTHNSDIYRDILTNYTKEVRPVSNESSILKARVTGYLLSVNGFDAVSGILTIVMILGISWKDERLTWNPADYGAVGMITIPQSKVWAPALYNVQTADAFEAIGGSDFRVNVIYNGDLNTNPGGLIAVKCSPDVSKFPFDIQTCYMKLYPWMYNKNEVRVVSQKSELDQTYYERNGEWTILETTSVSEVSGHYSIITIRIKLKRIPLYHIVNTLVPVYFLGFLNPLVFILPCDSGERSGYSLTMLLSYTVFMMVINASLPQTSDPMAALSFVALAALVCSGLITVLNSFQLRMYHKHDSVPVPKWLARFVTCLSCVRNRKVEPNVVEKIENDGNADIATYENDNSPSWKTVVNILDMLYLCVIYTFGVVGSIAATVYLSLS